MNLSVASDKNPTESRMKKRERHVFTQSTEQKVQKYLASETAGFRHSK